MSQESANLNTSYILHSSARLIHGVAGKLIIETPDGERVSLNSDKLPLRELAHNFERGLPVREGIENFFSDPQVEKSVLKLIEKLRSQRILLEAKDHSDHFGCELHAMYDYVSNSVIRGDTNFITDKPLACVAGEGVIGDAARSLLDRLDWLASESDAQKNKPLKVVCADVPDFDFFLEENKKSVDENQQVLFLWKDGAKVILGPIVNPGESACFNCYKGRLESNVQFVEEFREMTKKGSSEYQLRDENDFIKNTSNFLLQRILYFIFSKAPNLAMPNTLHSIHLVTGESKTQSVLKLPRCGVCGRGREELLNRAVRDLL